MAVSVEIWSAQHSMAVSVEIWGVQCSMVVSVEIWSAQHSMAVSVESWGAQHSMAVSAEIWGVQCSTAVTQFVLLLTPLTPFSFRHEHEIHLLGAAAFRWQPVVLGRSTSQLICLFEFLLGLAPCLPLG